MYLFVLNHLLDWSVIFHQVVDGLVNFFCSIVTRLLYFSIHSSSNLTRAISVIQLTWLINLLLTRILVEEVTIRSWRGAELTWCVGPAHGCDAALRPHGRAARGPREAQVAQTRGRRPRGSTETPVRGPTWQGGRQVKGPRVSGPW